MGVFFLKWGFWDFWLSGFVKDFRHFHLEFFGEDEAIYFDVYIWDLGVGIFLHRYLNVPNRAATVISTHGS